MLVLLNKVNGLKKEICISQAVIVLSAKQFYVFHPWFFSSNCLLQSSSFPLFVLGIHFLRF